MVYTLALDDSKLFPLHYRVAFIVQHFYLSSFIITLISQSFQEIQVLHYISALLPSTIFHYLIIYLVLPNRSKFLSAKSDKDFYQCIEQEKERHWFAFIGFYLWFFITFTIFLLQMIVFCHFNSGECNGLIGISLLPVIVQSFLIDPVFYLILTFLYVHRNRNETRNYSAFSILSTFRIWRVCII